MKTKNPIFIILLGALLIPLSARPLQVVTTYHYIDSLVRVIGGDHVQTHAMSKGKWDPHVIIPKPSLIATARNADLLIMNGAQLEIGWLPPVLRQANNPDIMPGKKGFLDLSNYVTLIQVPDSVSRAQGDIHPAGNPHYYLGPRNIPPMVRAIAKKLSEIDGAHHPDYMKNLDGFIKKWKERKAVWDRKMEPLSGKKVIEFHRNFDYFLFHYRIEVLDTIEPLPGIPPTSRHTLGLIQKIQDHQVSFIIHDVYHSKKSSQLISRRTQVPMVILPHDVNAINQATDIFSLFDEIVRRITQ